MYTYMCLCVYLGCGEMVYGGKMSFIVSVLILRCVFVESDMRV